MVMIKELLWGETIFFAPFPHTLHCWVFLFFVFRSDNRKWKKCVFCNCFLFVDHGNIALTILWYPLTQLYISYKLPSACFYDCVGVYIMSLSYSAVTKENLRWQYFSYILYCTIISIGLHVISVKHPVTYWLFCRPPYSFLFSSTFL